MTRISRLVACLLAATACSDSPVDSIDLSPKPQCDAPAPLQGVYDSRAPKVIVLFKAGTAVEPEVARLAALHAFTPSNVYVSAPLLGFAAEMSPASIAGVRCAASVQLVEYDAVATTQ